MCNSPSVELKKLEESLSIKEVFEFMSFESIFPVDPHKKYELIAALRNGLSFRTAKLTYSHGNSFGNQNIIWKIPTDCSEPESD